MMLVQFGNSLHKLRRPRSDAYSAEQVLLNKQQIWCGRAYLDCWVVCSLMSTIGLHCAHNCEKPPYNHYGHQ